MTSSASTLVASAPAPRSSASRRPTPRTPRWPARPPSPAGAGAPLPAGLPPFPVGNAEQATWIDRYARFDERCRQHTGDLINHVATADTARDLDLLRRAVGDPVLNYVGLS